ncbi:hydantoinase B/oxoprolinase family protein [Castellaniella sp. GW247-6E4]|uniref:hydantoinase B/oxoprolinase family protein n=1 Tax=Castellaniella sp. GW247-6E4 TaxID=3140380 RepID=UPI0033152B15
MDAKVVGLEGNAERVPTLDDLITLQIIRNDLVSIPNQIDRNVTRTAFSQLINEYKDYAVGIVDPDGNLISQSRGSLLIFAANALGTAVRDGLALHGEENLGQGDVLISNHAETLGQHLNNVVMYTPVRADQGRGEIVAFFCVLMHWIDVGGIMVGSSTSTSTTEIFQEGIQFRSVKLMHRGERSEDMFRMIRYNTRFPEELIGDVEAQIAGCLLGRDMVAQIVGKYGIEGFRDAVAAMRDHARRLSRQAIKAAPKGEFSAFAFLDNDGVQLDKTVPIGVQVRLDGERLTVDYVDVADQLSGPMNAGRNGGAVAAARIALKYLISPDEPLNEGDFDFLDVEIPEGKFLSARRNAPLGLSGHMIPTTVDTILRALAEPFPDRVAAAHHGTYGAYAFHGISAFTGEPFFHLDTSVGGWGASSTMDGYGPSRSNVHGDTSDVPIEVQEAYYPFRFVSYRLRGDSAGAGEFRGGLGVEKTYLVTGPCRITLKIDRTKCAPWGVAGGSEGKVSDVDIFRRDGSHIRSFKGTYEVDEGDRIVIRTGGGGGYGYAWRRDPERVRTDVRFGYVSREAALADYGVAFGDDLEIDVEGTTARRRAMSEGQGQVA